MVLAGICNFRSFLAGQARLGYSKVKHIVRGSMLLRVVETDNPVHLPKGVPWKIGLPDKGSALP
jgi:hypothetical protein